MFACPILEPELLGRIEAIAARPLAELLLQQGILRTMAQEILLRELREGVTFTAQEQPVILNRLWEGVDGPPPTSLAGDWIANLPEPLRLGMGQRWDQVRLQKLIETRYADRLEPYFLERRKDLEQVVYGLIRLRNQGAAEELYLRLLDDGADFTELAKRHSVGEERFTHGLVGPMLITQPHPTIRAVLESLKVGDVHAPFRVEQWVLLVRMEHRQPASLNDATRIQLMQELLQQEMDETLDAMLASFYPTLVPLEGADAAAAAVHGLGESGPEAEVTPEVGSASQEERLAETQTTSVVATPAGAAEDNLSPVTVAPEIVDQPLSGEPSPGAASQSLAADPWEDPHHLEPLVPLEPVESLEPVQTAPPAEAEVTAEPASSVSEQAAVLADKYTEDDLANSAQLGQDESGLMAAVSLDAQSPSHDEVVEAAGLVAPETAQTVENELLPGLVDAQHGDDPVAAVALLETESPLEEEAPCEESPIAQGTERVHSEVQALGGVSPDVENANAVSEVLPAIDLSLPIDTQPVGPIETDNAPPMDHNLLPNEPLAGQPEAATIEQSPVDEAAQKNDDPVATEGLPETDMAVSRSVIATLAIPQAQASDEDALTSEGAMKAEAFKAEEAHSLIEVFTPVADPLQLENTFVVDTLSSHVSPASPNDLVTGELSTAIEPSAIATQEDGIAPMANVSLSVESPLKPEELVLPEAPPADEGLAVEPTPHASATLSAG